LPVFGGMAAALMRTAVVEIQRVQSTPPQVSMSPAMFQAYLAARPALGIQGSAIQPAFPGSPHGPA